jgi:predicted permease
MQTLVQDLRYGFRMLIKNPGFTAVAIITLALGIGANTAIFSLIDAVMLRELPVKNPEQLVVLDWITRHGLSESISEGNWVGCPDREGLSHGCSFSYPTFEQVRAQNSVLSGVFAVAGPGQLNVSVNGQASLAGGLFVSGEFFSTLGVTPVVGRPITEEDDGVGASAVAVLSYGYWERHLGSDPSILGKPMTLNGVPFTVVGVTGPGFFGLQRGQAPDMWLPLSAQPRLFSQQWRSSFESDSWWLWIIGRLKPGVSRQQARADLDVIFRRSLTAAPKPAFKPDDDPRIEVTKISQGLFFLQKAFFQPLLVLMLAVGAVLLIACGNVANLQLARAAARQKEMAVRLALGGGRVRLIRQLLTENLLLAVAGGATGLLLAQWATAVLVSLIARGWMIPINLDGQPNLRVLGFTAAASLLTGVLFGLAPAFRATQVDLASALKVNASTLSTLFHRRGKGRLDLGRLLVMSQVGMTLVLLIGAGLLVRTLRNLRNLDVGFNPQNILLFSVDPTLNGYQAERIKSLYSELLVKLNRLPGVLATSFSMDSLIGGGLETSRMFLDATQKSATQVSTLRVGPRFFETMAIPLVLGRTFGLGDHRENAPKVAVVNETLARRYFSGQSPLGKRLAWWSESTHTFDIEILGVVADAKYDELRKEITPTVYVPYLPNIGSGSGVCFELRVATNPTSLIPAARRVVQEIDVNLPLFGVKTQAAQIHQSLFQERLIAGLAGLFGLLALVLAWVGLYGVMSYAVARRTNEIGIRMALGAQKPDVLRLVVGQGMGVTLAGIVIGVGGALALTRVLTGLLFGVKATDPITFIVTALSLAVIALLACYMPARRATKVDPTVALRYE